MSSTTIPPEILFKIIQVLGNDIAVDFTVTRSKKTLYDLSLTCKSVRNVALKYLFRHIILKFGSNLTRLFQPHLMKNVTCLTMEVTDSTAGHQISEVWAEGIKLMNVKRLKMTLHVAVSQNVYNVLKTKDLEFVELNLTHNDRSNIPDLPNARNVVITGGQNRGDRVLQILQKMTQLETLFLNGTPDMSDVAWTPFFSKIVHLHISADQGDTLTRYVGLMDKPFPLLKEVTFTNFVKVTETQKLVYHWICTKFSIKRLNLDHSDVKIIFQELPSHLQQFTTTRIMPGELNFEERDKLLTLFDGIPQRFLQTKDLDDKWNWTAKMRRLTNWIPLETGVFQRDVQEVVQSEEAEDWIYP